jgi:hypothetical protein
VVSSLAYPNLLGTKRLGCCCCCEVSVSSMLHLLLLLSLVQLICSLLFFSFNNKLNLCVSGLGHIKMETPPHSPLSVKRLNDNNKLDIGGVREERFKGLGYHQ